jgi:hypothetical protein
LADDVECYDAIVSARLLRQTPSVFPDCGPDCITITWPWFLKLDVRKTLVGEAPRGELLALTMQHTYFRSNLGSRKWWLRRNSIGGFNILRFAEEQKLRRCAPDTAVAKAYIMPAPGQTIDDLLREGEQARGGRS